MTGMEEHHRIRDTIANAVRKLGYVVEVEKSRAKVFDVVISPIKNGRPGSQSCHEFRIEVQRGYTPVKER